MTLPGAYLELVLLSLLLLPAGLSLLRGAEWALRRTFPLSLVERALLGLYAGGGALYVLATLPVPFFGIELAVAFFVLGIGGMLVIRVVHRQPLLPRALKEEPLWELGLLALGTLALLAIELQGAAPLLLPNAWDGSADALWVNLTVSQHTLPWTLEPYAVAGVTYPQGTTVWFALPVILFGWPIVAAPLYLPPLFLALSVPATYCWGRRLGGVDGPWGRPVGLLFAVFFGVVGGWPRLYAGGSYDLELAFPLFLILLGGVREFVRAPPRRWGEILAMGTALGVLATLSLIAAQALLVVLLGLIVLDHARLLQVLGRWVLRLAAMMGVVALFLARSIAGIVVWYGYPAHVLTQTGGSLTTPPLGIAPFGVGLLMQELDPFVPFKYRLSPFPVFSVILQLLLVLGFACVIWVCVYPTKGLARRFPNGFISTLGATAAILFAWTFLLSFGQAPGETASAVRTFSNVDETSYLMFIVLAGIASIPIVAGLSVLADDRGAHRQGVPARPASRTPIRRPWLLPRESPYRWTVRRAALAVGMAALFAGGALVTVVEVPGFLTSKIQSIAQATPEDLVALGWVGSHLPGCSQVLVAPGSAGQFLPEYAQVHLVYQMTPTPRNGSYATVVTALTGGGYNASTRAELEELGVTEVFVTGVTFPGYAAFDPAILAGSVDFRELMSVGDASVYAFVGGSALAGCPPA